MEAAGYTGTLTVNSSITITFTPLIPNSEIRVYSTGTSTELDGVENSATNFAASIGAGVNIDYKIVNPGYEEIYIKNVSFSSSQDVRINQQVDRNYA